MGSEKKAVVLGPGEGNAIRTPTGGGADIKAGIDETAGALTIYESHRPGGAPGGPPLHRHAFDEAFYVLEGEYVFKLEDELVPAGAGSFVYIPGGAVHTFQHTGKGPGRMLTVCQPGGIEEMFAATTPEERAAMEQKHGIETLGPPMDAKP